MLQDLGSSSLRAFLLKGLAEFFDDLAFSRNLITSKKLWNIEEIDGQYVIMNDGSRLLAEFIPVATSNTIILNNNVEIVISAISSVKNIMTMHTKSVRVLYLYFTDEEEILQIVKDRHSKFDAELRNAVSFMYNTILDNISLFKHLIKKQDIYHVEVIEKYLKLKKDGEI